MHGREPGLVVQAVVDELEVERFLEHRSRILHQELHKVLLDLGRRVSDVIWILLSKEHAKVAENHLVDERGEIEVFSVKYDSAKHRYSEARTCSSAWVSRPNQQNWQIFFGVWEQLAICHDLKHSLLERQLVLRLSKP